MREEQPKVKAKRRNFACCSFDLQRIAGADSTDNFRYPA